MADQAALLEIAGRLWGGPVRWVESVHGGGNNRLYRVESASGERFALKFYLRQVGDPRDRLGVETRALAFLHGRGVIEVPRLFACDAVLGCAALEWIDGERVVCPTPEEMEAVLRLVERLHGLKSDPEAASLPLASAAALSGAMLAEDVQRRFRRLEGILPDHPELAAFIQSVFVPAWERIATGVVDDYQRAGLDFQHAIAPEQRILSPSDFGFHNALRTRERGLIFLDFEYFGWDDPVKLVSDFCWHPGMDQVSWAHRQRFAQGVADIVAGSDPTFVFRLERLLPWFGLCWCLILLNEFLPVVWQRRVFASQQEDGRCAQARQLAKAERLMAFLQTKPRVWMS